MSIIKCFRKKLFLLLMVMALVLIMVPAFASATDNDITVYVSVENTTFTEGSPAWKGQLLVDVPVTLTSGSTVMDFIGESLKEAVNGEATYEAVGIANGYISSINGLAAMDGGVASGWNILLNDWFINMGGDQVIAADGDSILVSYTCDYGADLGGDFENNFKTLTDLVFADQSGSAIGTLTPNFSENVKDYTLTLPDGTTDIKVVPTATNKNFQVRTYLDNYAPLAAGYDQASEGNQYYPRTALIPVIDGSVLYIGVGENTWPSMNNQAGGTAGEVAAGKYNVTIAIEDNQPIDVKVGVYDYTAAGQTNASANGVVLAETTVQVDAGATAIDAFKAALDANSIPYVVTESQYGDYVSSVNGLSTLEEYYGSGWMFSVNNNYGNTGAASTTLTAGDVLEWHYSLTDMGADVGSYWGDLPIITSYSLGGFTVVLSKETSYDAEWNATTTYYIGEGAAKQVIAGSGSENDPFIIPVELAEGTALTSLTAQLTTTLNSHYQHLSVDVTEAQDYSDGLKFRLYTDGEIISTWYMVGTNNQPSVTINVGPSTATLTLFDNENKQINIGSGDASGSYNVYTASLAAGVYEYIGYDANGASIGGGSLTVSDEAEQSFDLRQVNIKASNSGFVAGTDFTVKAGTTTADDGFYTVGAVTANNQYPVLVIADQTLYYDIDPSESRSTEGYISLSKAESISMGTSAQSKSGSLPITYLTQFTVPEGANLEVCTKSTHFVAFAEVDPVSTSPVTVDGKDTYTYKLIKSSTYNYRVSLAGKLTVVDKFSITAAGAKEVTLAQMEASSPSAVVRNSYFEGNIYLNINSQNYLQLANIGDTYKLLTIRNWQAMDTVTSNYFIEPDYNFEILSGTDVISITPGEPGSYSTVTALTEGTAIVKVSYNAMSYVSSAINDLYSASYPELVGLFVVSVGQDDSGLQLGMFSHKIDNEALNSGLSGNDVMNLTNGVLDADIDTVYYLGEEAGALFTFTPTAGCSVSVLRPSVNHIAETVSYSDFSTSDITYNGDASVSVLLSEGRNIIKLEKDGKAEYQVITALPLTFNVTNITNPGADIEPGNAVKVTFEGLSYPAQKLSGIYNFNAQLQFTGAADLAIAGPAAGPFGEYNFITTKNYVTFTVPADYSNSSYTLADGKINVKGFGSPMGDHRSIDPLIGKNPNYNALNRNGYFSIFPEINIQLVSTKVDTTAEVNGNKATAAIDDDDVRNIKQNAEIEINAVSGNSNVKEAEINLSNEAFAAITAKNTTSLSIATDLATLEMDATALAELGIDAGNNDIKLNLHKVESSDIPAVSALVLNGRPIYEIGLSAGGQSIFTDMDNSGKIKITVPYVLGANEDPDHLDLVYIDAVGNKLSLNYSYENGYITFETNHLSTYAVDYTSIVMDIRIIDAKVSYYSAQSVTAEIWIAADAAYSYSSFQTDVAFDSSKLTVDSVGYENGFTGNGGAYSDGIVRIGYAPGTLNVNTTAVKVATVTFTVKDVIVSGDSIIKVQDGEFFVGGNDESVLAGDDQVTVNLTSLDVALINSFAGIAEGKQLLLISDLTLADDQVIVYDGTITMVYSSKYQAYAAFISAEDDLQDVLANFNITSGVLIGIDYDGDVNDNGRVNIGDAQAVYDIYNASRTVETLDIMRFEADYNGDQTVSVLDVQALVNLVLGIN